MNNYLQSKTPEQIANFRANLKRGLARCAVKSDAEVDRNIKRSVLDDWNDLESARVITPAPVRKPTSTPPVAPRPAVKPPIQADYSKPDYK